jgi:predicted metal-dependent hydrolase
MIVSAPKRLPAGTIRRLAEDRLAWAAKRLGVIEAAYARHGLPKRFSGGETFSLLGQELRLTVLVDSDVIRSRVESIGRRLLVTIGAVPDEAQAVLVQAALLKWYKQAARESFAAAVAKWAPVVGEAPRAITVRNQRRRWGSCSRDGTLNFNWRLIMTTQDVLDYVVVHELCHLLEPNHSARYWGHVERVMPQHARHRRWLKENAVLLEACF